MKKLVKTFLTFVLVAGLSVTIGIGSGVMYDWLFWQGEDVDKIISTIKSIKNKIL